MGLVFSASQESSESQKTQPTQTNKKTNVPKLLQSYLPQKPVKNWLGIRRLPSANDLKYAREVLVKAYPHLLRIDEPKAGVATNENYHVTVAHGIPTEEQLIKAQAAMDEYALTTDDLRFKRDEKTGQPLVQLLPSQIGTTIFVLMLCHESPKFKQMREHIIKTYLPADSKWTPKPAHVTTMYGIVSEKISEKPKEKA